MEQLYKIKINLGKLTVELESHDKEWLEVKEKKYLDEFISNPQIMAKASDKLENDDQQLEISHDFTSFTINEYYNKYLSGKSYPRTTVATLLFYYLEKIRKIENIKTGDVRNAFQEISFPKYDKINFTDLLSQLKKTGILNKINNYWKLTLTGMDFVTGKMK